MTHAEFESHKWGKDDVIRTNCSCGGGSLNVPEFMQELFGGSMDLGGCSCGGGNCREYKVYGANYREHTLKIYKDGGFVWVACEGYRLKI